MSIDRAEIKTELTRAFNNILNIAHRAGLSLDDLVAYPGEFTKPIQVLTGVATGDIFRFYGDDKSQVDYVVTSVEAETSLVQLSEVNGGHRFGCVTVDGLERDLRWVRQSRAPAPQSWCKVGDKFRFTAGGDGDGRPEFQDWTVQETNEKFAVVGDGMFTTALSEQEVKNDSRWEKLS